MQASAHKGMQITEITDGTWELAFSGNSLQEQCTDDATFCPCFMMHEFKPAEFHATCCKDKIQTLQQKFFAKPGDVTQGKLLLQQVTALCPSNTSPCVCQPYKSTCTTSSHNSHSSYMPGITSLDVGWTRIRS